jgi:3,2-trans-enoyl-CoA isomerase
MILSINHGPVRELRLNRPPVNALSLELVVALRKAIQVAPQENARALVLSATPGRFSAGLDVPLLLQSDRPTVDSLWREFYALLKALAASPIPIAAAITGHAPAGGTVLPLFCDWRVAAKGDFKLGLNEVQVGITLPPVILSALQRLIGARRAERLAVRGLLISPEEAASIGLVDELAEPNQVVARAIAWCESLVALPAEAMLGTRQQARADLNAIFSERNLDAELEQVIAGWWAPGTQSTLRGLAERLGKKA